MTVNEQIVDAFMDVEVGREFTTSEIKKRVNRKHGTKEGSVIPTDICFNSSNIGVENNNYHHNNKRLFLKKSLGVFIYVGPDFEDQNVNQYEFGTVNK